MEIAEGTKMWWYEDVSRADFEAVKDTIEQIMLQLGRITKILPRRSIIGGLPISIRLHLPLFSRLK